MIRIGTSGWHYPTGASWNGTFYPKPRPKGFDELEFYSRFFDCVEINTTFYGQPRAEIAAQWTARTQAGFVFCVKLFQQFTHPKLFTARVKANLVKALGTDAIPDPAIAALIEANQADLDAFRRGIAPLANAGKLGALLAQFPASFRDSPTARLHLAGLLRAFHDYPVAVELRHRSWTDNVAATRVLLDAFNATWAWIDEPKFKDSIQQSEPQTTPFVYARLHGRNATQWWRGSNDERYNYLYTEEELEPIVERLRGKKGFLQLNNHANARAAVNGLMVKGMLGEPVQIPESFAEGYPELAHVITRRRASVRR